MKELLEEHLVYLSIAIKHLEKSEDLKENELLLEAWYGLKSLVEIIENFDEIKNEKELEE